MDQNLTPVPEQEPQTERRRPARVDRRGHGPLPLIVSAAALAVACAALFLAWPRQAETPPEPEPEFVPAMAVHAEPVEYITYRGHQLPIDEGLAVNDLDKSAFVREGDRVTYETEERTALQGIDVSAHQREIDWNQVADSGIDFAILRLGFRGYGAEGSLNVDERFHANMKGALAAGLKVGVYFFSQATDVSEAEAEARLLLRELEGYEVTFPVVFDWERIQDSAARTNAVNSKTITLMAETFCAQIEQAGYTPGVYFNQDMGYLELELGRLADYSFWLAEYDERPDSHYRFDLWQYSSSGTVPGIEGKVDLNLAFTDFGEK